MTREPASDERTIHRFEAFSDIVIGFSLAQLGATLVIPPHGQSLFADPTWLIAFLLAFTTICALWFFHHRLFASIFVPRTIPIILNFAWLAVVVLCAYSTQLIVRIPEDPGVWRMYYGLFFLAYGILAVQYVLGMQHLHDPMSVQALLKARRQTAFMALWTAPFLLCTIFVFVMPIPASHFPTMVTFVLTGIASGLLGRYFRKAQERLQSGAPL